MSNPPSSEETQVRRYLEARNYIDVEIIRLEPRLRNPAAKVKTALEFNERLGNPQAAYPAVQIAGTSGKGSTAFYLSRILAAAGHSTGLHISPYLQVATEKTWTDGLYAHPDEFYEGYLAVKPVAEEYRNWYECPTSVHGLASLGLSYEVFRRQQIDWCVMETGVGGRHDLVQGLQRVLAVITDLGLDHTRALGDTLGEIAWHKAGIMSGAVMALATYDSRVWGVLEEEAQRASCALVPVVPERVASALDERRALLRLPHLGEVEIELPEGVAGYPLRNAAVAGCAADALRGLGVAIEAGHVAAGLSEGGLPGRLEVVQRSPTVLLDAAHNAQKFGALMTSLPRRRGRLVLVVGFTGERPVADLLSPFSPSPDEVVVTRPLLFGKKVMDPHNLALTLRGWCDAVHVESNPRHAIGRALDLASPDDTILVTGSLYLVGQIRDLWHPWRQVLLGRSSNVSRV